VVWLLYREHNCLEDLFGIRKGQTEAGWPGALPPSGADLAQAPLKPEEKNAGGTLVGRKWDASTIGSGQKSPM